MEQASQETTVKFFQDNVCDLANILWNLATQQSKISQQTDIPEGVFALFAKAEKGVLNARELADGLKKQLTILQRPDSIMLLSGKCTDVGQTRSLNEDSLLTIEYAAIYRSASIPLGMYAVADGMGGHEAGDVASQLTCQELGKQFVNDLMSPAVSDILPENVSDWLTKAFNEANQALYKERQTTHSDMGNTLVAALFVGNSATIANVGDSRCYHLTQPNIKQITRDHSLVERLVETGQITRNQANVHPQKNVIYRVIGDKMEVDVDIFELSLEFGEALLLCSDGLSGMLSDSRIHKIWQASQSPQQACDRLVDAANQAGGEDNITVIIVQVLP
jgi:protein phosphatase